MTKSLSERIADLARKGKKASKGGKNRAAFLAVRDDVRQAIEDGWSIKAIWHTLREEGKIPFGYDAFISYVNQLVRKPSATAATPDETAGTPSKTIDGFTFNSKPKSEDLL